MILKPTVAPIRNINARQNLHRDHDALTAWPAACLRSYFGTWRKSGSHMKSPSKSPPRKKLIHHWRLFEAQSVEMEFMKFLPNSIFRSICGCDIQHRATLRKLSVFLDLTRFYWVTGASIQRVSRMNCGDMT